MYKNMATRFQASKDEIKNLLKTYGIFWLTYFRSHPDVHSLVIASKIEHNLIINVSW